MKAILISSIIIALLSALLIAGFHIGAYDRIFVLSYGVHQGYSLFAAKKLFFLNLPGSLIVLSLITIRSIKEREILMIDNAPKWAKTSIVLLIIYLLAESSFTIPSLNSPDFRYKFQFFSGLYVLFLCTISLFIISELKNTSTVYDTLISKFKTTNKIISIITYTLVTTFIVYCFSFTLTVYALRHNPTITERYTVQFSKIFKPHINTYFSFRSYRDFVNMFGGKVFISSITKKKDLKSQRRLFRNYQRRYPKKKF